MKQENMTSEEFQRQFGRGAAARIDAPKPKIRMPAPVKMTKAEAQYLQLLEREFPECEIRFEEMTLKLPHGTRYTPDFSIWAGPTLELLVEVKGSYRLHSAEGSHEKFKSAVAHFKRFPFRFAQKQGGEWSHIEYNTKP